MKKLAIFAAAFVLSFGLAQCKKEQPTAQTTDGETVHITVKVGASTSSATDGSKANVDPASGHITFNDGDKLYVGYNNAKVGGELTYSTATSSFSGDLTIVQAGDDKPLYFYYLGGSLTPDVSGTAYTVDISDQSSNYPVISYGTSTTDYTGSGSYETTLLNQCGLVKFNLATGTDASVSVGGLYTKATINFANPGVVTPGTTGSITLHEGASTTERWAILLPQAGVSATATISGYTCSIASFPDVAINDYNTTGVDIAMTPAWDGDLAHITSESTEAFATATDGMTITGTLGVNKKISIADGATVTLDNVSINYPSGPNYESGFAGITCLGDATIILKDGTTNNVAAMDYRYPGIQVGPTDKTLTIQGTGTLNAKFRKQGTYDISFGCGIGGGGDISCGNIVINDGTINAEAFNKAAGIGSGCCRTTSVSCGTITINGGTVTATGGAYAAGIGTGYAEGGNNSCGAISINGGTVTATGGLNAAGIGTGYSVSYKTNTCASITITDGVTQVTATKGSDAPNSIGAGNNGTCGTVTIGGVETGPISDSPYTYPVPLTYPIALGDATSDYVGSVVTTDGYVYATVDAADAASKTAVAVIAYVGTAGSVDASSASYKGLAIALSDANSGNKCQWAGSNGTCVSQTNNFSTALGYKDGITCTSTLTAAGHSSHGHDAATAAASNNGTAAPTGTSGWFMPSMGQWNLIVQGLATKKAGSAVTTDLAEGVENNTYKADNLNSVITDAGGTGLKADSYWTSTEEIASCAWAMHFWWGWGTWFGKTTNRYVRSVIAF